MTKRELRLPAQGLPIMPQAHSHLCYNCGTEWQHADDTPAIATEAEFWEAHTCPNCGRVQREKYRIGARRITQ